MRWRGVVWVKMDKELATNLLNQANRSYDERITAISYKNAPPEHPLHR